MAFPQFYHYDTPIGYELQREHGNPNYHRECYKATETHRNAMGDLIEKDVWVLDDCYTQICPDQDVVWHEERLPTVAASMAKIREFFGLD